MADVDVTWEGAYNDTDTILIAVEGLIHAARILADEHPLLNTPDRESAALDPVLRTLEKKSAALRDARSAEYRAGLALQEAGLSAATERGKRWRKLHR